MPAFTCVPILPFKEGTPTSVKRSKRKAAKAATKRAKPKRALVKKAARKVKHPVAPVIETVAVEAIEQPAPGVGLDPAA